MIYLLHISDLHLVADPQWNNMKNAILESVRETLREVPLGEKLLVITGDFHNFIQNNFVYAEEFVLSLVKAMGIDLEKDVFVIPGNHDVSNNIPGEVDREALLDFIKRNPEKLYQNNRIDKLLECYKGYEEFVKKIGIYKETDGRKPMTTHVRTWRGKLNLLHLNTALVADGSEKTGQMADTLTATSQEIRDELRRGNLPCIAIGHNSFYDLEENQRNELAGMFFQEGVSAYLSGDRHQKNRKREEKSIVLGEEKGTVTIPNVVGYRTSADKSDTYSDFGMIWHLWDEQTGTVRMKYMRWDPDDQGKMHEDGEGDPYKLTGDSREQAGKKKASDSEESSLYGNGSCWMTKEALSEWNDKAVKQNEIRNFLLGKRCSWKLAFSENLIVERDIVNDLYQKACEGGVYVLLGPGGEGKTTALMQMCAKLFREGTNVFYYRGHGLSEFSGNIPDHSVFILDNPPERPALKKVLDKAIEEGITLIIGSRENEWNLLKQSLHISGRDIQEVRMPKLCAKEAWGFADCVCNNLKHMKERKEIKDIFLTNSYGFLYAAMLLAVNKAESLEEIAHQIIENLSHMSYPGYPGMLLLAHIVLAEKCGAKLTKENFRKVCEKLKMSPQEGSRALSREIRLNGENYQTRHEVISNLFYRELFSDGGRLSQEETDKILTGLLELKFGQYDRTYGLFKKLALKEITGLCKGLSLTSLETCQYLADRVLDEIKTQPKEIYDKLFSAVKQDERTQLILFRQCFDRRWLLTQYLKIWCDLLSKKGASWDVTEEYSPAWILRKACIEKEGVTDTWMLWAKMEEKERGAGEYSKENTALWIYRKACEEKHAEGQVWLAWAQLEEKERGAGEYSEKNTARWIYRKACEEKHAESKVWLAWGKMEEKERGAGEYSKENTARWIYQKVCEEKHAEGQVWLAWAQLEEKERGAGEYSEKNTARWIYRKACEEKHAESKVWLAWGKMEEKERGAGEYSKENTARWIYRKACLEKGAASAVWTAWGQLEEKERGAGEYSEENTALWIYRKVCLEKTANYDAWTAWAQLEEKERGAGEYSEENTALWIYRKACLEKGVNSAVWAAWAQLEEKERGAGEYSEENTALWIYRKACLEKGANSAVWAAWAQLEEKERGAGEYSEENTALWIYRKACLEKGADSAVWTAWGQLEEKERGAGKYSEENTALWIYRKTCLEKNANNDAWLVWAQLEEKERGAGEYSEENTALWIYRKACLEKGADGVVWVAWAKLEEQKANIGEYDQEYTARWILNEGIKRFPNEGQLYSLNAYLELRHRMPERARKILRKAIKCNDYSMNNLAILELYCGNIDTDSEYCTNKLMAKMKLKKELSFGALQGLYYCSRLLGKEEDAESYYEQLRSHPNFDPDNTAMEEFIHLCQKALQKDSTESMEYSSNSAPDY